MFVNNLFFAWCPPPPRLATPNPCPQHLHPPPTAARQCLSSTNPAARAVVSSTHAPYPQNPNILYVAARTYPPYMVHPPTLRTVAETTVNREIDCWCTAQNLLATQEFMSTNGPQHTRTRHKRGGASPPPVESARSGAGKAGSNHIALWTCPADVRTAWQKTNLAIYKLHDVPHNTRTYEAPAQCMCACLAVDVLHPITERTHPSDIIRYRNNNR